MGNGVHAVSQTRNDGKSGKGGGFGKVLRHALAILRHVARADNGKGAVGNRVGNLAAHIKTDRRIVNRAQKFGIILLAARDDADTAAFGKVQLMFQIDVAFPVGDLLRKDRADSLNHRKIVLRAGKDFRRRPAHRKKRRKTRRPDPAEHVQNDISLSVNHFPIR